MLEARTRAARSLCGTPPALNSRSRSLKAPRSSAGDALGATRTVSYKAVSRSISCSPLL
jgi:hypothetical protein